MQHLPRPSRHLLAETSRKTRTRTRARIATLVGENWPAAKESGAREGEGKAGKKKEMGESKEVAGLKGASLREPGAGGLFYMVIFYPPRPR